MKQAYLHWLLDPFVLSPMPLRLIVPKFDGVNLNSPPIPGHTLADYASLLISALNQGHVQLIDGDMVCSPGTAADN
jgi:hypothetical protein